MDRSSALAAIASAFSGVRRDSEPSLHQAQLTDRGMSAHPATSSEWRLAGQIDSEVKWSEVPGEALDECAAALSHLLPVNWRFYLPAYICRSLSKFVAPNFESEMLRLVMFHLTLPADAGSRRYLLERYETLSVEQHIAVRSFLQFVEEEALRALETTNRHWGEYEDARIALASYWGKDARDA